MKESNENSNNEQNLEALLTEIQQMIAKGRQINSVDLSEAGDDELKQHKKQSTALFNRLGELIQQLPPSIEGLP